MKSTLISLIFFLPGLYQTNASLIKTSAAYRLASTSLQVSIKPEVWEIFSSMNVYTAYYVNSKFQKNYETQITAEGSGQNFLISTAIIKINQGLSISISLDPHASKQGFPDYVEVAIMDATNGVVSEVDYGYVKKEKFPNDQNLYLEIVTLKNGSKVLIRDNQWIYSFKSIGDATKGLFAIPAYPFY